MSLIQRYTPQNPPPDAQSCGTVARLNYLARGSIQPLSYACQPPAGTPWENSEYEARQVSICDGRYAASPPSIDREGFELWNAPSAVTDFLDEALVKTIYYAEAIDLALAVTGGSRAYVFDHLVRRREADRSALSFGRRGIDGVPAANGRIHNDYTEASGLRRLGLVVTDTQVKERVSRYSIVNVWRSIKGPVLDTPLAVCDARTLTAQDLVCGEVLYPNRTGEIYLATHSPHHRWSYFSKMDRHEALIFKQYDSQLSGVARFTPHAAFDLADVPADAPLRESIELRCLVLYGE